MTSFAQWNFKAGLVAPLPVDMQLQTRVQFRSFMGEISKTVSPKVDITLTGAYLTFSYQVSESFQNIVAAPGIRYNANKNTYFGVTCGPSWFSENLDDYFTIWSPYIGVKSNHISADLRYFNWRKTPNNGNTLGIVLSYVL